VDVIIDGVTTQVDVDFVTARKHRALLETMLLSKANVVDGLPYIPLEGLIVTKLDAGRVKDDADVTEILKDMLRRGDGTGITGLRTWLKRHAADIVEAFDDALVLAEVELRGGRRRT
jgi:hypothetical protein